MSVCDIFIWIGVCRDELIYWVLTSEKLIETGIAVAKVFEGQVFMTEEEMASFFRRLEELKKYC